MQARSKVFPNAQCPMPNMTNPHLGGDALKHLEEIIPDTHEMRLIGLIEACKIIQVDLNLGRIDTAIEFLAFAIAEAEKPMSNSVKDSQ
ncbi:MAG: hypothetical protein RMZ42_32960 [Nostoc sp. DedQUE05]|uniref:hypothetical protein n=1 Tax=Nostoc sp. DedQUE05 TaxID=3075391 RepID=UPI002AD2FC6C|nr:hypothetical protein [Nostoc sp. DedQUE05]MDZ8096712.1 hypothetical protein [Nostoc sp. DedQUE05]